MLVSIFHRLKLIDPGYMFRYLIIAGVLLGSAILGRFVPRNFVFYAALSIIGIIAFLFLLRHMELGILFIIPVSFLAPWQVGTGTAVPFHLGFLLTMGLIGIWLFRMFVVDKAVRLVPSRVNMPSLWFLLAITISLIAGNINWSPWIFIRASTLAQLGGWLLYALSIAIFLMVGNVVRQLRWLKYMTWIFIGLGGLYIISFFIPGGKFIGSLFSASSSGAMLWVWLAALIFGQVVFNVRLKREWRIALGLLLLLQFYASWFNGRKEWVSGWLPALVACMVILYLRSWRLGLAVTVVMGMGYLVLQTILYSELMTSTQEYSFSSRMAAWSILFEIIKMNPVLGLGPANYYFYTPSFSLLGWNVRFNSHNNYIDILAQTGLVGMALFTWLVTEIGFLGLRLRKVVGDGFCKSYVNAALGGLAGTLVAGLLGDWFLPFLYNIGISGFRASVFAWLFLGGLIALEQIASGSEDKMDHSILAPAVK